VDFTREPIIESVITPKEGCKLVVRSSKAASQEEFFVDSVEVVSFGHSLYFRSLERPKSFFVPANDYEILEVRETRLVLKNVGLDRTIKIGGGREVKKEREKEKEEAPVEAEAAEPRVDKKRDKRRHSRRRRSKSDMLAAEETKEQGIEEAVPSEEEVVEKAPSRPVRSALLPPPSTLISETIARYKDNALFKDAFFLKDEDEIGGEEPEGMEEEVGLVLEEEAAEEFPSVSLPQPEYGSFEMTEEEEEEIYRQRQKYAQEEPDLDEEEDEQAPPKVSDELIGHDETIDSKGHQ
jgi:hypothetical protein